MTVLSEGPMILEERFPVAEPGVAGVVPARNMVLGAVAGWNLGLTSDVIADLKLCATEVLTNAARHAGGIVSVTVSWTGYGRVRCEVRDRSGKHPEPNKAAKPDATNGRGLLLVEELSAMWGWEPEPQGKRVWFEIAHQVVFVDPAAELLRRLCDGLRSVDLSAPRAAPPSATANVHPLSQRFTPSSPVTPCSPVHGTTHRGGTGVRVGPARLPVPG